MEIKFVIVLLIAALPAAIAGCSPQSEKNRPAEAVDRVKGEESTVENAARDSESAGTTIKVAMLTQDPDDPDVMQIFDPRLVRASVGDTITFVPTDPGHQSSSIEGMIPDGAQGWEGEIGEKVSYVFKEPGIYGFQCVPHYGAGMVGLVIIEGEGMTDNLESAKAVAHPGLAGRAFIEIFAEARARGLLSRDR